MAHKGLETLARIDVTSSKKKSIEYALNNEPASSAVFTKGQLPVCSQCGKEYKLHGKKPVSKKALYCSKKCQSRFYYLKRKAEGKVLTSYAQAREKAEKELTSIIEELTERLDIALNTIIATSYDRAELRKKVARLQKELQASLIVPTPSPGCSNQDSNALEENTDIQKTSKNVHIDEYSNTAILEIVRNADRSSDIQPEAIDWCKDFIANQPGSWETEWMTPYQIVVYAQTLMEEAQHGKLAETDKETADAAWANQ